MFDHKIVDLFVDNILNEEIETAISQAEMLGWLLWKNDIGIYSLQQLENALSERVRQQLALKPDIEHDNRATDCEVLFLATEMYLHGGHSRLAENLSSYLDNNAVLLVTRGISPEVKARAQKHFRQIYSITRHKKDRVSEIRQIVQKLLGYRQIIVNIHPSDIVSTIACVLAKQLQPELKIFFVNHADHVFNFGVSAADVWFEISQYGLHLDATRELTSQKSFLGIPVKVNDVDISKLDFHDGDLMMTAGATFKYKPVDSFSLMPLLDALLQKYGSSTCQVIGVDPWHDWWWWPLKLKYRSRLQLSGTLPYSDYLAITNHAKLYIDSQPLTGGTAFVEQFFHGKQCVGLKGYIWGYTPLDYIKQENPDDVLTYLSSDNRSLLERAKQDAILVHSPEAVKQRFINALNGKYVSYQDVIDNGLSDDVILRSRKTICQYPKRLRISSLPQLFRLWKTSNLTTKCKLPMYFVSGKIRQLIESN